MPVPATEIRTAHAITIRAANKIIGQIQGWSPAQARDIKPKFEINAVGTGLPIEHVPGVATTQTLQISRYDLYTDKMEEVWGTPKPLYTLTDQHNPIDIEEKWIKLGKPGKPFLPWMKKFNKVNPLDRMVDGTRLGAALGLGSSNELGDAEVGQQEGVEISVEKLWYSGCWFSNLGRNIQSQGDRMILVNATLVYTKVRPLL